MTAATETIPRPARNVPIRLLLGSFVTLMALAILGNLALVCFQDQKERAGLEANLHAALHLQAAIQALALHDPATSQWPGDLPDTHTAVDYLTRLVREGFLPEADLPSLGRGAYPGTASLAQLRPQNVGYTIWRPTASDPGTCLLLTTRLDPPRDQGRSRKTPIDPRVIAIRKDGTGAIFRESELAAPESGVTQPAQYPLTLPP